MKCIPKLPITSSLSFFLQADDNQDQGHRHRTDPGFCRHTPLGGHAFCLTLATPRSCASRMAIEQIPHSPATKKRGLNHPFKRARCFTTRKIAQTQLLTMPAIPPGKALVAFQCATVYECTDEILGDSSCSPYNRMRTVGPTRRMVKGHQALRQSCANRPRWHSRPDKETFHR